MNFRTPGRVVLLVALSGCARAPKQETDSKPTAAAAVSAPVAVAAAAAPARASVSVAGFDGKALLLCTDFEGPAEKIEKIRAGTDAGTVLGQSCESLGQPALTTCKTGGMAIHYYRDSHSDKYMADCVKSSGVWSRNVSPEAELARSKQELEKLQGEMK
jgi:hypothetical protein